MKLLAIALLGLSLHVFGADIFSHKLKAFPKAGRTCPDILGDLGRDFASALGTELYSASVSSENSKSCDFEFGYVAESRARITNTIDYRSGGSFRKGTFTSETACKEGIEKEKEIFQKATGLTPWVSFCFQEDKLLNSFPFVSMVEAIGQGERDFFTSEAVFTIEPVEGWVPMLRRLGSEAVKKGHYVASLVPRPYMMAFDKEVTIRYYASERLYLRQERFAHHKSVEICQNQIAELEKALSTAKRPPLLAYCGTYFSKEFMVSIVDFSTDLLEIGGVRASQDTKRYSTLAECRAAVSSTLTFYRENLKRPALAAFCADGSGAFQMTVFEEKAPTPKPN